MKILEIYVSAFGCLRNVRIPLSEGLNTLVRPNGWGKSTLAAFLKAMLYGLPAGRGEGSERKKYTPWEGGAFGGSITFTASRGTFRAERFFGGTPSEDRFALYDAETGEGSRAYSSALGEELFGIDAEGFARTVLLTPRAVRGRGGDLASRLSGLVEAAEDTGDFEGAMALLEKRHRLYAGGSRGRIAVLEGEEINLGREREGLLRADEQLRAREEEYRSLSEAVAKAEDEERRLRTRTDGGALEGRRASLLEREERLRDDLRALAGANGALPDQDSIEAFRASLRAYRAAVRAPEETAMPRTSHRAWGVTAAFAALAALAATVTGAILSSIPLLILGGVCLILCATSGILAAVLRGRWIREVRAAEAARVARERETATAKRRLRSMMDALGIKRGTSPTAALREAEARKRAAEEKGRELAAVRRELEALDATPTAARTDAALRQACARTEELRERRAACKWEIERLGALRERLGACEAELSRVREELERARAAERTLVAAMEHLRLARASLSARYPERMRARLAVYMEMLSRNAPALLPDASLSVSVRTPSGTHPAEALSLGWQGMIDFCMRLSLSDVLFEESETPMLILDDPFVHLDAGHLASALRLLDALSARYQILYTVCHADRGGEA